jgi:SAM-dependent methyltransferase
LPTVEFTDPRLVAVYETVNAYAPGTQPDFYLGLAAELGVRSVVDLGCGTGLITRELARQGYDVTGVDPAFAMLEVARHRPDGERVRWIHGDASLLPAGEADLAIMSGHVAQFFADDDEWAGALRALWRALRPGGRLAFESRDPRAREWERWTSDHRRTYDDPAAGRIEVWAEVRDARDGVIAYDNHYAFVATGEEVVSPTRLRFRTLEQLTDSLVDAGFSVERVFGHWDRRAPGPASPELVLVACRRDS